jgi:tetratricopeptide (TPR) repeat protein
MGDSEKALTDYNRALDLGYDEPQSIYYDRASAYLDLEEWELAKADYNRVLQAEPDTPGAYLGRGIAYVGLNSRREAAADFAQWLTMQATLPVSAAIPESEDTLTLEMVEERWYTVAIKGEEGQAITVAADSSDMDPLLVIVSGQNEPLSGDDDGGDGLGAHPGLQTALHGSLLCLCWARRGGAEARSPCEDVRRQRGLMWACGCRSRTNPSVDTPAQMC